MSNTIDNLAQRIHEIRDREEAELRRLLSDPSNFNIAQMIADRFHHSLLYLCNFESAVNHNGGTTPIQEIIERLQQDIRDEFRSITGKSYSPTICRQVKFRNSNPNIVKGQ